VNEVYGHGSNEAYHPADNNCDACDEKSVADLVILGSDLRRTGNGMNSSMDEVLEMLAEGEHRRRLLGLCLGLGLSLRSRLLCLRLGLSCRCCLRLRCSNRSCCNGCCYGSGLGCRLGSGLSLSCGSSERHATSAAESNAIGVFLTAIRTKHIKYPFLGHEHPINMILS